MAESNAPAATPAAPEPRLELSTSRQMPEWMAEQRLSLAFTTYQAGKLFLIGLLPDGKLSLFERTLPRCMGLAIEGNSLYVSSLYQLWRFENTLAPGEQHDGYDRLYLPQVGYVTGDLDVHDVALDSVRRPVFVNTLFSCLSTVSETHSFVPVWKPPFISRLAAEDRCHLNGLAMAEGRPRFVTAVAETDVVDGWREHRTGGGVVIDVAAGRVVVRGLSMPHSPRWYRNRLWLHDSGTGQFGFADLGAGKFVPLAFCPGYLRGMAFVGDYAVVGLSKSREERTFSGLPLEEALRASKVEPRCGIHVIDLKTGDTVHWLRIEGVVRELYDVQVIPGARQPMMIGFVSDEIRRVIHVAPFRPLDAW